MHRFGRRSLDFKLEHVGVIASSERSRLVVHHRTLDDWTGGAMSNPYELRAIGTMSLD